ncbi:MAG: NB-ARC domain-containing protein [Bacteroidota bacterium]
MNSRRRRRGVILTAPGQQKLHTAVTKLEQAERLGQKITLEELAQKTGLDPGTVAKVLEGEKGCDLKTLDRFFRSLDLQLTDADYAKLDSISVLSPTLENSESRPETSVDWGEAADVSIFYGRTEELNRLKKWILQDRCRLVLIQGMGGIGKTALSIKLLENIYGEFDYCIWRSLREAPPIEKISSDLIKFLSNQQEVLLPETVGDIVTRLIHYLNESRCLLVLDNVESILKGRVKTGRYLEGYEGYGTLISRIGESRHQSCLILTSREKPRELGRNEGPNRAVHTLSLNGLDNSAGCIFLKAEGLEGENAQWQQIVAHYSGNPLALKIIANTIQDLFGGDVDIFLKQGGGVFGDIRDLLEQQFQRLSEMEQSVMYWLMINREPTAINTLKEDILNPISNQQILETLQILQRRSLVECAESLFTLQNVVMEYVTENFLSKVCEEIESNKLILFNSHALIKATSKDYVRESQVRLILNPVFQYLTATVGCLGNTKEKFNRFLKYIRENQDQKISYAVGNYLNLLIQHEIDLSGYDLSKNYIMQLYAKVVDLSQVNFRESIFLRCIFAQVSESIYAIAFSPDNKFIATGDSLGAIHLWDIKNGNQKFSWQGHNAWIWSVSFSPDGQTIASSCIDKTVRLWNIETGNCLHDLKGHVSGVREITFSSDGEYCASGGFDNVVKIWDVQTGKALNTLRGHTAQVCSIAFSPDNKYLASGSADKSLILWDRGTGEIIRIFNGHTGSIRKIKFKDDGTIIATVSTKEVKLWDLVSGKCVCTSEGPNQETLDVVFRLNDQIVAYDREDSEDGCDKPIVYLWDVSTQQKIHALQGHSDWVPSSIFSSNGQFLATGSYDRTVRIWDVNTGKCIRNFGGYISNYPSIRFITDTELLVIGSEDGRLSIWDSKSGKRLNDFSRSTAGITSIRCSLDGEIIATVNDDHTIGLWNVHTLECTKVLHGHTRSVWSLRFSPDNKIIASYSQDKTIKLWHVDTGKCLHTLEGHTYWVWSISFSNDGKIIASGGYDPDVTIRLWNVESGECLQILEEHKQGIHVLAFNSDNKLLTSGSYDGTVKFWSLETGKCIATLNDKTTALWAIAFDSDNCALASSVENETLKLWKIDFNGRESVKSLQIKQNHNDWISSVNFSDRGDFLASSSHDASIGLWDTRTGKHLKSLEGHTHWVCHSVFSSDSQKLASLSEDKTIKVWDVKTGECLTTIKLPRQFEGMDITGVRGLSEMQYSSLLALGAVSTLPFANS